MNDYDFFDLTGLPFDPAEKTPKKVIVAIEKTKKELNKALGTETQQTKRDEIHEKLECLESFKYPLVSGGKLTPAYENLAKTRTRIEVEKLTATAYLLKQSGRRWYTDGMLCTHRQKTKLLKERVEEVFRTAGFVKSPVNPLKYYPKFPTNADKIYEELGSLRKKKDPNPNAPNLATIKDLYAFAAYLDGGMPENAEEYRSSKSTHELKELFDDKGIKLSGRNDDLGKLLASINGMGKSFIFNDDKNRKEYDEYLKYKNPLLVKLFSALKKIPQSDLLDLRFAEEQIKQISMYFTTYDVALAIYNKEASLTDEPYEPSRPIFYARCSYCHNASVFDDIIHAQEKNKCQIKSCGKPLFKQCSKCKKPIQASIEKQLGKCPECGFVPVDAVSFAKYLLSAEEALRKSDFETARKFLFLARTVDPSEKKETNGLNVRITCEEKRHAKPIEDLRKMLVDRAFQKAYGELTIIRGEFPTLNISAFEAQISTALSQVRTAFASTKNLSSVEQAKACLAILHDCVDFEPALNLLAVIFANNISSAEQALRKGDFGSARNFLYQAQLASPNDRSKTGKLATQIANEEKRYEEPINQLRKMIAARMFQKAAIALSDKVGDFPGLFIFESQIFGELSKARTAFVKTKALPVIQQAEACLAILQDCADFMPAINFLMAMFEKHYSSAEEAIRKGDLESAHKFMLQARDAAPREQKRINALVALIDSEKKRYEKPINDLRKLIVDRTFQKAYDELAVILGKFPSLDVSKFEMQINAELSKTKKRFENTKSCSPSKKADECLAILRDDCRDFKPAISYLQATVPEPCSGFSVNIDSSMNCVNINWQRSTEQGITYRLLRRQGKEMPVNEKDGEFLLDDSNETSYCDKNISPGRYYGYGVYAIRYGIFSFAVTKSALLLAEVCDARIEQIDTAVRITWNSPQNCTGITIHRIQNGIETEIASNAQGSFEDKGIQYRIAYSYVLVANYSDALKSHGVGLNITPMPQIRTPFTITATQIKGNTYRVS